MPAGDVSDLAAALQLGPSTAPPRSRSSLGGRKSTGGAYRPPRPSSLSGDESVGTSANQSLSYSVSRSSVGGAGSGAAAKPKNYHSRFQKVGETSAAPAPAPEPRAGPDGHPCVVYLSAFFTQPSFARATAALTPRVTYAGAG